MDNEEYWNRMSIRPIHPCKWLILSSWLLGLDSNQQPSG